MIFASTLKRKHQKFFNDDEEFISEAEFRHRKKKYYENLAFYQKLCKAVEHIEEFHSKESKKEREARRRKETERKKEEEMRMRDSADRRHRDRDCRKLIKTKSNYKGTSATRK